jgi:hypothetical protein
LALSLVLLIANCYLLTADFAIKKIRLMPRPLLPIIHQEARRRCAAGFSILAIPAILAILAIRRGGTKIRQSNPFRKASNVMGEGFYLLCFPAGAGESASK